MTEEKDENLTLNVSTKINVWILSVYNKTNTCKKNKNMQGMLVHAYNASTWETEIQGLLWVQGQPGIYSESQGQPTLHKWTLSKIQYELSVR